MAVKSLSLDGNAVYGKQRLKDKLKFQIESHLCLKHWLKPWGYHYIFFSMMFGDHLQKIVIWMAIYSPNGLITKFDERTSISHF